MYTQYLHMDARCWEIVASYLHHSDKLSLRLVCKSSRRYNNIISVPRHIKLTDKILLSIPALKNLKYLNANDNLEITDNSVQHLTNLKFLNARNNPNITDKSVKQLDNLHVLYTCGNFNITDDSIEKLSNLQIFECWWNLSITKKCISTLKRKNPDCKIFI